MDKVRDDSNIPMLRRLFRLPPRDQILSHRRLCQLCALHVGFCKFLDRFLPKQGSLSIQLTQQQTARSILVPAYVRHARSPPFRSTDVGSHGFRLLAYCLRAVEIYEERHGKVLRSPGVMYGPIYVVCAYFSNYRSLLWCIFLCRSENNIETVSGYALDFTSSGCRVLTGRFHIGSNTL